MTLPPTTRLYYDDSLLLGFDARVIAHGAFQGTPSVVLDRTAFYPEAGGQMADHGALGGRRVRDVQVDDDGVVHHLLEPSDAPLPPVAAEVHGEVDRARRRVHMALHTGQHMLSRALADVARAETVSARLGETVCTLDVDRDAVDERDLARVEDLVNAVIDDDVPVRAFFPAPAELASLPLRRAPKVRDNVRVVMVGDFDVTPCGGTHCARSAQVGLVRITAVERYKGKVRVSFEAGRRARAELVAHDELLRALAREFTCGPTEVGAGVEKLRRELASVRESLGNARARLAERVADELLASQAAGAATPAHVLAALEGADTEFLRAVASRVTGVAPGGVALLAAPAADGVSVVLARGAQSGFDCGAFLKRVAASCGGRGGGRAERAEGRLPAGSDWAALARAALAAS